MTDTVRRAANGSDINPRNVIECQVCHLTLGVNAIHNMIGKGTVILCSACVTKPSLHRRYYPQCHNTSHDLLSHPVQHCTRASARALINSRRVRTT